ncbi:MAG: hypothetical protein N4A53_01420 [Pelagimonas sp.]|jgi:hypothetical protein|nr:hypothetical protein [Pelagimonas sp.]
MRIIFVIMAMSALVTGCDEFSGDSLRTSFPIELQDSQVLFSEQEYFVCALAAIEGRSQSEMGTLPTGFSDWMNLPIRGNVNENSIIYRILDAGDECWTNDAVSRTDASSIWDYDTRTTGYFANRGDVLVIFDAENSIYLIVEG